MKTRFQSDLMGHNVNNSFGNYSFNNPLVQYLTYRVEEIKEEIWKCFTILAFLESSNF